MVVTALLQCEMPACTNHNTYVGLREIPHTSFQLIQIDIINFLGVRLIMKVYMQYRSTL